MRYLLPCLLLLLAACGDEAPDEPQRPSFDGRVEVGRALMGTEVRVLLYADDESAGVAAANDALDEIARLEQMLSTYIPESELSKLNAADHGKPVSVSAELWQILGLALDLARKSGGTFDPTVGPLVDLWKAAGEKGALPSDAERNAALAKVGFGRVELHPPTRGVRFTVPGMRIDLGGFAKGFAAQAAWALLGMKGFPACLVDVGGDVVVGAAPPGKAGWDLEADGVPVRLVDCAAAGSGHDARFVTIDDELYSHIVDPRTGLGLRGDSSIVVIARDGPTADAMATAALVHGGDEGLALIESAPGAEARMLHEGKTKATSGFAKLRVPAKAAAPKDG